MALGFIDAYKSEKDRRVTVYTFNPSILEEISDYCFMMRRNRMWEAASFISNSSTESINKKLAKAGMRHEWMESISNFISKLAQTAKATFGEDQLPNVIPLKNNQQNKSN